MVAKPTKPTVPDPALRSEPDTFGDRVEANVVFWETLVTYMSNVTDYTEEQVTALLLENLPSLSGKSKDIVRVNAGETAVELLATSADVNSILEAADLAAIKTILAYGDAADRDVTVNSDFTVGPNDLAPRSVIAAAIDASAFGTGQSWSDVSGSRAVNTSYQNTTGRTIAVSYMNSSVTVFNCQVSADGSTWVNVSGPDQAGGAQVNAFFVVPDDHYYRVNGSAGIKVWSEFR